jgi:hypothetical protein
MLPQCTLVRELPNDDAADRIASAYDSVKGSKITRGAERASVTVLG